MSPMKEKKHEPAAFECIGLRREYVETGIE